jgi:hypothetical protein
MYGALSDDYAAEVTVDGVTVNVNIDTGSVAFAVAGHADIGCDRFLDTSELIARGQCDESKNITVTYGTGWWSGIMCNMTVGFGSGGETLQMTNYSGGLMLRQRQMTTCARTADDDPTSLSFREKKDVFMEGIAGFAFPDPHNQIFHPLLSELFFGHGENGEALRPVFGLQSCGYEPIFNVGGDGALDLGGFDSRHYEGDIRWTSVVEPRYWGVHMTAVRLGTTQDANLLPENQTTALDEDGHARTVVDSGTSMALFDPTTFERILETLRSTLKDAKYLPDSFYNGETCVTLDELDISKWPPLTLEFAGEGDDPVVLTIPACRYVELVPPGWCVGNAPSTRADFPHDQPAYSFAVGKMPPNQDALLGQVLFEQYYVAHDMTPGKERIGFAPLAGCAQASYCVDGYASPGAQVVTPHSIVVWGAGMSVLTLVNLYFFRRKPIQRLGYTEVMDR